MAKKAYGRAVFLPPFQGRISESCHTSSFLEAVSDCRRLLESTGAEILLDSRNRVGAVNLRLHDEKRVDVVIKEFQTAGIARWKSLFVPSKAFKAWHGAWALVERVIQTPLPLAYLERKERGFLQQSFFLAEKIADSREIRFLFREWPEPEIRLLLYSLARYLFLCHEKGILHRDLSDGNILVKKDPEGKFYFYLLDTNRIRLRRRLGILKRLRNLVRLGVPPKLQPYFLEQYFGGRGLRRYFIMWYKINKALYSGFVQIKKKLRLKKLVRQLRIQ